MSLDSDCADKLLLVQSKVKDVECLVSQLSAEAQKEALKILQDVVSKLQSKIIPLTVSQSLLTCETCSLTFTSKSCFEKHVQGHSRNDCSVCGKSYSRRRALVSHMREEHQVVEAEKLYECTLCNRKFAKKNSLVTHTASHAAELGKVACLSCGLFFSDEAQLSNHSREHEDACKHSCEICSRRFKRKQQLDAHLEGHEKNRCAQCGNEFSDHKLLVRHCAKAHNLILEPEHRKRSSSSGAEKKAGDLVRTVRPGRPKKSPPSRTFRAEWSSRVDSDRHMCDKCGGLFSNKTSLSKHLSSCEPVTNEYRVDAFKCNDCGQVFNDQLTLVKHSRAHDVERPFLCHCGRNYKHLKHLQRHLLQRHNTIIRESGDDDERHANDAPRDDGPVLDADAAD